MFSKSTLLATLIGFFVHFMLGWLIYDYLAASFFEQHANIPMNEEDMNLGFIALGSLLQIFVVANLFRKLNAGESRSPNGINLGIWIGVFVGLGINLMMYGTSAPIDLTGTLVDAVLNLILYGVTGAVIGWAFKVTRPKSVS